MAAPAHDWFIKEWMATLGLKQADLIRETGWSKSKMSEVVNGIQPYGRSLVNEIAGAMKIQPFELLMHPHDAMSMRRLRQVAADIVAAGDADKLAEPVAQPVPIRRAG